MSDFFRTRMGQRFYEATMPKIADQLERLNANLEALTAELRRLRPSQQSETSELVPCPQGEEKSE